MMNHSPIIYIVAAATCLKATTSGLQPLRSCGLPHVNADAATLQNALGIVFGIIGALALLMVVISGLRYITAAGDPQGTAKARNGIIYALVGLAVAISAEAIVAFVGNRI